MRTHGLDCPFTHGWCYRDDCEREDGVISCKAQSLDRLVKAALGDIPVSTEGKT